MDLHYVFGPVSSGRLGRSLGLDLLGRRICSLDCLYCECGITDYLTTQRGPYVAADVLMDELAAWKAGHAALPDVVTLGGLGEPTLNSELGSIISGAAELLGVPVAVLTNSTMLRDPDVCRDLALADDILPSLDSLVESEFRALNRPAEGLSARAVADALARFRAGFDGRMFLEILLVDGINSSEENLGLLRDYVAELKPDRVDVVTMTRPGAFPRARAVAPEVLDTWRAALGAAAATPRVRSAVGAEEQAEATPLDAKTLAPEIVAADIRTSLERRPQTASQLAVALGVSRDNIDVVLATLLDQGHIATIIQEGTQTDTRPGATDDPFYALASDERA